MGAVQDKLEHVRIIRTSPEKCVASAKLQVSPTFLKWIFRFGKRIKILSLEELNEEYRKRVDDLRMN